MFSTADFELFSGDFWQKAAISGVDISLAPADLTPKTLAPWLGTFFWLLLLLIPLSGVQRTQPLTGATYVLFLTGSALTLGLLFCLPWIGPDLSGASWALFFGALAVSSWRWRRGAPSSSVPTPLTQEKGPTP